MPNLIICTDEGSGQSNTGSSWTLELGFSAPVRRIAGVRATGPLEVDHGGMAEVLYNLFAATSESWARACA